MLIINKEKTVIILFNIAAKVNQLKKNAGKEIVTGILNINRVVSFDH